MSKKQWFALRLPNTVEWPASLIGKPDLAKLYLWRGTRRCHIRSMIYYLSLCVRGTFGLMPRVLATIIFPFVAICMGIVARFLPFSVYAFISIIKLKLELFDNCGH
jgi:hypothetical protein